MTPTSAKFVRGIRGTDDILHHPFPQVAFIGRSNVGKSSTINALLNERDLVKVGDKPGKTTEVNFFLVNGKYYFVDLPGYGFAESSLKGVAKIGKLIFWYLTKPEPKPLKVVLILDVKAGLTDFDAQVLDILRKQGHRYLIVANKMDKLNQRDLAAQLTAIRQAAHDEHIFAYSAVDRKKTAELLGEILSA